MFPLQPIRLAVAALAIVAVLPQANAQTHRRHRVYAGAVMLQPFSVYTARPIAMSRPTQLAYYAPQPLRTEAPIEDFDSESDNRSEPITSSGSHPTVGGSRAVLRNGIAYAPSSAPDRVKSAIWAVNTIRTKPYIWGGGHGSFSDRGYDCSGTVSFALHNAGLLSSPLPSSDLMHTPLP
jgi:cell wall-associated NlpC family hydrolase